MATSWLDFANALLAKLGAPATQNNRSVILAWMAGEQPPNSPNAQFNPLNIQAHGYPGEGGITGTSGSGQFNFADFNTGVTQTANFLSQSRYAGVVASLRANATAPWTLNAIQGSGWAASGYGGRLTGLLSSVLGNFSQYANGKIAGASAGSGSTDAHAASFGIIPNPLDLIPGIGGGVSSTITDALKELLAPAFKSLTRFGLLITGVGGGVALIVLGGYQATSSIRKSAGEAAEPIAKAAPAIAAVAAL